MLNFPIFIYYIENYSHNYLLESSVSKEWRVVFVTVCTMAHQNSKSLDFFMKHLKELTNFYNLVFFFSISNQLPPV